MNNRFKVFLSATLLYALLIFYLSSKSSLDETEWILDFLNLENLKVIVKSLEHSDFSFLLYPFYILSKYPDKVEHIILYAGFGLLLYFTLKRSSNPTLRNYSIILAIIIGTAYGASDEFHQSFVPGRSASFYDLLADSIGITLVQTIIFIKDKLYLRQKNDIEVKKWK